MSEPSPDELARNRRIAQRFVSALPATPDSVADIRATMAADAIWEFALAGGYSQELNAFTGPTRWDREGMIEMQLAFGSNVAGGYPIEVLAVTADGDRVVVEAQGRGMSAATSRPYRQRYSFHLRLRNGVVVEGRVYQDTLHLWDVWMHTAPRDFFLDIPGSARPAS